MYSEHIHINPVKALKMSSLKSHSEQKYYAELKDLLRHEAALMRRLTYLRQIQPNAYVSAGIIRNLVWSKQHHQNYKITHTEIDVIFFDGNEKNQTITQNLAQKLTAQFPENEWDVVNQAYVHTWYKTEHGQTILPYTSLYKALSFWPETATAIAIRLLDNDDFDMIAPFGLSDLFELKLRWNSRLVSHAVFIQRIESKKFLLRWPQLQIED